VFDRSPRDLFGSPDVAFVVYASAGGTWKLEGDKYTEKVEFATPSHEHLRGKEVVLDVVVKGDKFHQHGVLDTGFVIDEDWIRKK
jgi:hypothetical protein